MKNNGTVLAVDTSNYTTSVAALDMNGNVIADERKLLEVKKGERGLRQSHALFQHISNLPELIERAAEKVRRQGLNIVCAAASDKPRPEEGSYMPVFLAGVNSVKSMAAVLGVPAFFFSHQEGHIAAVCGVRDQNSRALSFHMSGGTGEIVELDGNRPVGIVGGIRDISFGQLIDRVGVALGYGFPAGAQLDLLALRFKDSINVKYSRKNRLITENGILKPVHTDGTFADLSGIETECMKAAKSGYPAEKLAPELFFHISEALVRLTVNSCRQTSADSMIFVGGVASSGFIRNQLEKRLPKAGITPVFGKPELSTDNAVGIGRLAAGEFAGRLSNEKEFKSASKSKIKY